MNRWFWFGPLFGEEPGLLNSAISAAALPSSLHRFLQDWKGLSALLVLGGTLVLLCAGDRTEHTLLMLGFGLGTAGWVWALFASWKTRELALLMALALLCRLLWLAVPPLLSDDWARYLWDGTLWLQGLNPFETLPSALPDHHPELLGAMNSPDYYTVYPPLAQLIFRIAAWTGAGQDSAAMLLSLRLLLWLAEAFSIGLMLFLLPATQKSRALLYALAPLALAEGSGNIHLEVLDVFFVLCSALALRWYHELANAPSAKLSGTALRRRTHFLLIGLSLMAAVAVKLHPLLLALTWPFLFGWKRALTLGMFSAGVLLLAFSPFVSATVAGNLSQSLDLYFRTFEFNGGLYSALRWAGIQYWGYNRIDLIGPLLGLLGLGAICAYLWWKRPRNWNHYLASAFWIAAIHQLSATTVHPWYILPLLAWSCFVPWRFGVLWAALIPLSYLAYTADGFQQPHAIVAFEYILVWGVLLWEVRNERLSD